MRSSIYWFVIAIILYNAYKLLDKKFLNKNVSAKNYITFSIVFIILSFIFIYFFEFR